MAATASYASVILGLLATYCYRFPSVLAIPDRKENIYVEEEWPLRRSYRLEDFLWSGSGDGQEDEGGRGHASTWRTTTVIRTTTVLTTVFPTPLYTTTLVQEYPSHTPQIKSPLELCSSDLIPSWSETIKPTPTIMLPSPTVRPPWPPPEGTKPSIIPEKQFWLVTVLNINASLPEPLTSVFESRLARLYRIAFNRQQERHLGITNATSQQQQQQAQLRMRRARERRVPEPVSVHVFNKTSKHPGELELLYTVHVAGKPVLAHTAAADMRLVLDNEVTAELGYPVITKAEPYLKGPEQLGGVWKEARARDTWLLIGSAVAALLLLLILLILVVLGLGKRKRNKRRVLSGEGKREEQGEANKGFQNEERAKEEDEDDSSSMKPRGSKASPSFIPVGPTTVTFKEDRSTRKHHGSSSSISSASSGASLVKRRHRHGHRTAKSKIRETESRHRQDTEEEEDVKIIKDVPQPAPRKRHPPSSKSTKVSQSSPLRDPQALSMQQDGVGQPETEEFNSNEELAPRGSPAPAQKTRTTASPNSYLSMPSIKAFPRGASIPEPLARVLEPMSIRHLDAEGGIIIDPVRRVARHGSMEGEDPGVIGPMVWDLHCHRMQQHQQQQGYLEEADEDVILDTAEGDLGQVDTTGPNVGRMRRRFHELLDDAFSLFGSRSESPGAEEESSSPPVLHRVHSAIVRPVGEPLLGPAEAIPRPSTSADPRRPATAVTRPRGAWGTCNPSPHSGRSGTLPRPLSAGPFHRPQLPGPVEITIDRTLVLTDSQLLPADPAIPLIAAIKEELRKFQGTNVHPISLPGSTSSKP